MLEKLNKNIAQEERKQPIIGLAEWFRPGEYARVESVLADIKALGVKELRTNISWADYNSDGGKDWYHWLLPRLATEVNVLPCFQNTPASLGIALHPASPPAEPKAYAEFLNLFITELGAHFEWVELWSEPENKRKYDYTPDTNGNQFAQMLSAATSLVKQRGKKTILGGLQPFDSNWLQFLFEQGVMQNMDAMGVHGLPEFNNLVWEVDISQLQAVLNQNNSSAEIWITGAGFSTWQHDEFKQLQEFRLALQANAAKVYWYSVQDLDPDLIKQSELQLDEREYYFGLKRTDGSPKLLYRLWAEYGLAGLDKLTFLQPGTAPDATKKYSLITGGAGFVGTNLAKRLLEEGKRVLILDNLSRTGVERNLQWLQDNYPNQLEVQVADIRNLHTVKQLLKGADQVFHFAAQVAVTTSLDIPINDFEINARGTLNVLEGLRTLKNPPPLVFTSTNKVYGGLEDLEFISNGSRYNPSNSTILKNGIGEDRPLDFHSPYGCSKGAADQYVIDYARTFNIPAVVFRMSCIYGPHQYGNEDQGWVAHFAIRAIEHKVISIYGDGKQVRDVLFVEDLVDAFLLAQKHMPQITGQAFNIGGGPGNTTSLLELLNMIGEFQGHKIPLNFDKWRPGDQHYYVSDIRKFQQATGWYPKHTVQEGVSKLYRWLCEVRGVELPADFSIVEENENTKVALA